MIKKTRKGLSLLLLAALLLSVFTGCSKPNTPIDTSQSNGTTANTEDTTPKGPIDLNKYHIILPDGAIDKTVESLAAYELKAELANLGYAVLVKDDNGSATIDAPSILIGKTAATEGDLPDGNKYSIVEKNGQIQISAGNYYGYRAAISYFKNKVKQNEGCPRGLDYAGTANVSAAARATSDSLRVMFYNVYGMSSWQGVVTDAQGNKTQTTLSSNQSPTPALRQDLQADLIKTFAPDVIGFQEFAGPDVAYHTNYQGTFIPILADQLGYTQVAPEVGAVNCTPLFYNANKLEIVSSGYRNFEAGDDSKGVTWAVFSVKSGTDAGKTFAVFNTHFAYESGKQGDLDREKNAIEILGVINEVSQNGKIASFMGGDLNFWNIWGNYDNQTGDKAEERLSETKPYKTLTSGGMILASNITGVQSNFWSNSKPNNYTNSYHGYYEYNESKHIFDTKNSTLTRLNKTQYTLDYIFLRNQATSTVTVKSYRIVEDDLTDRASDHCPTFVDFVLK